jgi:probable addiction module antidote protein
MPKARAFDVTNYRNNPRAIAEYLTKALSTKDAAVISAAIGDMARAQGATGFAKKAGMGRVSVYKSFGGTSSPAFDLVFKALIALDIQLIAKPAAGLSRAALKAKARATAETVLDPRD